MSKKLKARLIHNREGFDSIGGIETMEEVEGLKNDTLGWNKQPDKVLIPYSLFKQLIGIDEDGMND